MTTHFNRGILPLAFVFSAPGTKEKDSICPVVGATGINLQIALARLTRVDPQRFPTQDRYSYRITNAYAKAISRRLGSGRTEATRREILEPENVHRVIKELRGCHLVVLCGVRAQYLLHALIEAGFAVVSESHTSNQALIAKHNTAKARRAPSPSARQMKRAEAWASSLLKKLPSKTVA